MSRFLLPIVRLFYNMTGSTLEELTIPQGCRKAIFGLGCFWAPDGQFPALDGVYQTRVGYAGGKTKGATYKDITDHTEVIEIVYDPSLITYAKLLDSFWAWHNPTFKPNFGKGSSTGRQYISLILYNDDQELETIKKSLENIAKKFATPIKTDIQKFDGHFYEAELYHQKYHLQNDTKIMSLFGLEPANVVSSVIAAKLSAINMGQGGRTPLDFLLSHTKLTDAQIKACEELIASGGCGATCGL